MEESRRALRTRWQGDVPVTKLLLEHRDRRPGIVLQALGDGDSGRIADFGAAKFELAVFSDRVFLDEQVAIALIAHGRLGVAACGEAETNEQRDDRGSTK